MTLNQNQGDAGQMEKAGEVNEIVKEACQVDMKNM